MRAPIVPGLILAACVSSAAAIPGTPREGAGDTDQRSTAFKDAGPGQLRFVLQRKSATIVPGSVAEIEIELQSFTGKKVDSARDLPTRITVTTLESLAQARAMLGPATPEKATKSLDRAQLTLPAKSSVLQQWGIFPRGEGDIKVKVALHQPGLVRVFVEAEGVASGATIIAVGRVKTSPLSSVEPAGPRLILASFQPNPPRPLRLRFFDLGNDVWRSQEGFSNEFAVGLETLAGDPMAPAMPLIIRLEVAKGTARFVHPQLSIAAGSILSENAELRSKRGGEVTLRANAASDKVAPSDYAFAFALAPHAEKLQVLPSSPSALANGLSPIYLTIKAIETPADGAAPRVMTASREGLAAGRPVSLRFENGACWFVDVPKASAPENSQAAAKITDVMIPAEAQMASVAVYCSQQASNLKVIAEASNALDERIEGSATMSFSLPVIQLVLAVLGAMVLPVIWRLGWTRVLVAALVGGVVYTVFFVGAVATGNFNLGAIAISLTKLPTENVLAAFALGVLGYLAAGPLLPVTTPPSQQPPAGHGP
jgi:hypothetical protein